jgi:hypothetical protein
MAGDFCLFAGKLAPIMNIAARAVQDWGTIFPGCPNSAGARRLEIGITKEGP